VPSQWQRFPARRTLHAALAHRMPQEAGPAAGKIVIEQNHLFSASDVQRR
jgi:hypothetical protein